MYPMLFLLNNKIVHIYIFSILTSYGALSIFYMYFLNFKQSLNYLICYYGIYFENSTGISPLLSSI
jgi:hypothetical protein